MTPVEINALMTSMEGRPELIETHISFVVLAGEFAYKIKKPVKFSFLDFSNLQKRAECCRRELQLNRRLAAEIYLEVVPICENEEVISICEPEFDRGTILDYAVKMKRLDANLEMDRMLAKGLIDGKYLKVLARKVAAFHLGAHVIHASSQSNPRNYETDFEDILVQTPVFERLLGASAKGRLEKVVEASAHYLATHAKLIQQRLLDGFIRDVHGDLHSRNIFAYPDPVVFDCIEFNDHFRQIDVLNEVAFLCMDLEAQGFPELSAAFLEAYSAEMKTMHSRGEELLFVWFKCYRANIRAKVTALGAAQPGPHAAAALEMERYLALMEQYAAILTARESE